MRNTYRVFFIDSKNGYHNQKLLEADCIEDIYDYMASLGHIITDVNLYEQ